MSEAKFSPNVRIWMEGPTGHIVGKGGAAILEAVDRLGSIAKAAKELGMSYKYVWDYLNRMSEAIGSPVVETRRGGRKGGGTRLSEAGRELLRKYKRLEGFFESVRCDAEGWEALGLKISARNRIRGVVKEVIVNGVAAKVKIEVQGPVTITSLISKEAAEELGLREGDVVEAVIKATEVMVAKQEEH